MDEYFQQPKPADQGGIQPISPQRGAYAQPGAQVQQTVGSAMQSGEIRTMPDKFINAPGGVGGSGVRLVPIAIIIVVVGILGFGGYYVFSSGILSTLFGGRTGTTPPAVPQPQEPSTPPVVTPPASPTTPGQPPVPVDSEATARDAQRITDVETIVQALESYFKQFGSYPQFLSLLPKTMLSVIPTDPKTKNSYTYTPKENRTTYGIVVDFETNYQFKGQQLQSRTWEFTKQDFVLPSVTVPEQPPAEDLNADIDGDGLTLAEERLMTTQPSSADSDSDGYPDNAEIQNFYSPIQTGDVKLDAAGLVASYTDAGLHVSFYYPTNWVVTRSPGEAQELLITVGTGEDIAVTMIDNPDSLTSWEWYSTVVNSSGNRDDVRFMNIGTYEAVRTLDERSVYVSIGTHTYSIVFMVNSVTTMNYPNVFQLLLDRMVFSPF